MNWDNISKLIAKTAPLLGGVLLGPAGAAGGKLIASALGTSEDPEAIAHAIKTDPSAMLKLKQLNNSHKLELEKLLINGENKRLELNHADTASARAREVALKDRTPKILAYSIVVGFFGVIGYLLANGMASIADNPIAMMLLGTLASAVTLVLGYYFGSSSGSKNKSLIK